MEQPGSFLEELAWRGLLHQTTSESLPAYLSQPGRVAYAGFDPTSDSLTIGNYVPMKILAHWQRAGHRPIVLMGAGPASSVIQAARAWSGSSSRRSRSATTWSGSGGCSTACWR